MALSGMFCVNMDVADWPSIVVVLGGDSNTLAVGEESRIPMSKVGQ